MKRLTAILLLGLCLCARANVPALGVDSVSSEWFRDWYQYGDLRHYLDNLCNYSTYEAEQSGEFATADGLIFSIHGNSYRWNKYYKDGYRIDSRIETGSTLFHLDMTEHTLALDYHRSQLYFSTDTFRMGRATLFGNAGGVGGYSRSAIWVQELLHKSAIHRMYPDNNNALTMRQHVVGAGGVDAVYGVEAFGQRFHQHVYANYTRRSLPVMDYQGITGMNEANNITVQLDGQLPLPQNRVLDRLDYFFVSRHRGDAFSEYKFNDNELATETMYTLGVYGLKDCGHRGRLTTGLNWELQDLHHNQLTFTRNLVDQDGEGFEPWYADGKTHSLNWTLDYRLPILNWLDFHIDSYNSLLHFDAERESWENTITYRTLDMSETLYIDTYQWHSQSYTGGMLENSFSLEAKHKVSDWLRLKGSIAFTLDGILLRDKAIVSPCWEAQLAAHFSPVFWFEADVILGHYRTRYSYDDMRFLSSDYLNRAGSGGALHHVDRKLQQPAYFMADIPFTFIVPTSRGGRHEFQVLSSMKKYYNTWNTISDGMGGFLVTTAEAYSSKFFLSTPLFLSNDLKYTYQGRKVFFTLSWQSYMLSNVSALGNGVLHNNINVLSESTASPLIYLNEGNSSQADERVRRLGRNDQDRGFIARIGLGWNITANWGIALNAKFKDGTPFANFCSTVTYNAEGKPEVSIWHGDTKGDNVEDTHFGKRKDAIWQLDVRLRYRGAIKDWPFGVELQCYNVWDFANELVEYCFDYQPETGKQIPSHRYALSLNIPRGLLLRVSLGLEKTEKK